MANFNLYSRGDRIFGWANAILLGLFVLSTLYPFIYVLSVSLSSGAAVTAGRVTLWPVDVTLAAYDRVLSDRMFWVAYGNTFIYTFGGTLMSLLIMIPGAYALSRKRLRGRTFFNIAIAFTLWFNAGMIPFFLNMRDLGLLDRLCRAGEGRHADQPADQLQHRGARRQRAGGREGLGAVVDHLCEPARRRADHPHHRRGRRSHRGDRLGQLHAQFRHRHL